MSAKMINEILEEIYNITKESYLLDEKIVKIGLNSVKDNDLADLYYRTRNLDNKVTFLLYSIIKTEKGRDYLTKCLCSHEYLTGSVKEFSSVYSGTAVAHMASTISNKLDYLIFITCLSEEKNIQKGFDKAKKILGKRYNTEWHQHHFHGAKATLENDGVKLENDKTKA